MMVVPRQPDLAAAARRAGSLSSSTPTGKRPRSASPERRSKRPHLLILRKHSFTNILPASDAAATPASATSCPSAMFSADSTSSEKESFPSLYHVRSSLNHSVLSPKRLSCGSMTTRTAAACLDGPYECSASPGMRSRFPVSATERIFGSSAIDRSDSRCSSTDSVADRLDIGNLHCGVAEGAPYEADDKGVMSLYKPTPEYSTPPISPAMSRFLDRHDESQHSDDTVMLDNEYSPRPRIRHQPIEGLSGAASDQLTGSPRRVRYSMGYKRGCQLCEQGAPGHYSHLQFD